MRDLGRAHPLIGASRSVPADAVAAAVDVDIRTINPPVTQGWMVALLAFASVPVLLGLAEVAGRDRDIGHAAALLVGPVVVALAVIALASARLWMLELHDGAVLARTWLAARLGRRGRDLGPASALRSDLLGDTLALHGPHGGIRLSMLGWPPSARLDVFDELPIWGVDAPFAPRPSRRAERDRRREEALERRRRAEEERGRH